MSTIARKLYILCISTGFVLSVRAQDLHFSQVFNTPLTINPANTGFTDYDYRLGLQFRNQWSGLLKNPYKTFSVFGDAQILRDKFENAWIGIGGVILHDKAGTGVLQSTKVYGSFAYHQMLGESHLLSAGFNAGWVEKRVDPSKLVFPSQFNGSFFDNTFNTAGIDYPDFISSRINYFDIQAGIKYAYFPDENTYINTGFSIHHVNNPKETFFDDSITGNKIASRYIAFGNAIFKINDRLMICPNLYYTKQAGASEYIIGTNFNIKPSIEEDYELLAGAYLRPGDAIIGMAGFSIGNIRFTFSYDATISNLKSLEKHFNALEFNLLFQGFYTASSKEGKKVLCPIL